METRHFQKVVLRMKLFLPLQSFICHIGCKNMFLLMSLSKSKFFTRVALVSFVQYSCRTCVVRVGSCHTCVALVLLVSHSCCQCHTRVAFVSPVSLVSGTRVVNQTRSFQIVPPLIVFHLPYSKYKGVKICFYTCRYQNQFFSLVLHSCHSCSTHVAPVLHSCHLCLTRVTSVALVLHSCCKLDQIRQNYFG